MYNPRSAETPVEGDPRAEAQWVSITVKNWIPNSSIKIQDAKLDWGKFYEAPNKSNELSAATINSIVIAPSQSAIVSACGRANAASGTEGRISLYEGSTRICQLYWDCPWGSKWNNFKAESINSSYIVTVGPWNDYSGALGNVYIDIERN
ncbi:aegerolysin type hemolysin [Phlebopus sp. FC_14]|nr:aegerolysin type hemolysin [Phlebopus sp. FC_14]